MTRDNLNKHILFIQCKYADLVKSYTDKAKYGKKCEELESSMVIVKEYIDSLYCYHPFDNEVTYAYKFTIIRSDLQPVTITITIGTEDFVYIGDDSVDQILSFFEILISSNIVYNLQVDIIDGELYVYSYDSSLNFNTNTSIAILQDSDQNNAVELQNLASSYCSILDHKNCLTIKELCTIIEHANELTEDCNC